MKTPNFLKLNYALVVLMLALGLSSQAHAQGATGALPVTSPDQQQADAPPQAPNEAAEQAAAASQPAAQPADAGLPPQQDGASNGPGPIDVQPPAAEEPPAAVAEAPAPRPKHVKTAKEQLAFDKKLLKDTKSKIAKVLQQERQGDKDLKKAKAAIKSAEANLASVEKKKAKIQASLKGLEKTRVALEKTLKKTNVAMNKDAKKAGVRLPASAR